MRPLEDEIAAYDQMLDTLKAEYLGKWVVIHGRELVGAYRDFDSAAEEAIRRFGRGPYLIRRVGVERRMSNLHLTNADARRP